MLDRYHVVDSMEEWLAIKCNAVETVILKENKIPRFEFNIKIVNTPKYRDLYISNCAIAALKKIKSFVKSKNIEFNPNSHIKFAFEYNDSIHCYKISDAPKPRRQYPQPADYHVALAVVTQLFDAHDVLGGESEDVVVYYYLCILRAVNHPVINHTRFIVNDCPEDGSVYDSALVPKCEKPNSQLNYYALYADLMYFLGLLAPPICVGDNVHSITTKVRKRHAQQLKKLCSSVGITKYEAIHRGEGWQKLTRFLEANPLVRHVLVSSILMPPETDDAMTVIENQVVNQIKELWQWTGLYNFRECYLFAVNVTTDAHEIPVIAEQSELVKLLYQKLKVAVIEEQLIPFAKLLIDEKHFFDQYDACNYPDLFYASRSYHTANKLGNPLWEEFVATRSVTVPREEIEAKLANDSQSGALCNSSAEDEQFSLYESTRIDGTCVLNLTKEAGDDVCSKEDYVTLKSDYFGGEVYNNDDYEDDDEQEDFDFLGIVPM